MIDDRWCNASNILLIRLDNLGDVLLTTPAFHAVRESLPEARLTLLASPVGAQIASLNPDLDEVLIYQAPWVDPWQKIPHDSAREQAMINLLKARHFDAAIIFTSFRQSSLPSAYLCYLADIPLRLAASIDGSGSLLTTRYKHSDQIIHEVEHNLNLVNALGFTTDSRDLVLQVPVSARQQAINFLTEKGLLKASLPGPLVVLHPGCSMPARTYPWQMYATIIDLLVSQLHATVILTGAEDELPLIEQLLSTIQPETRLSTYPLAGALPFPEFCALIEQADLTITNNTGPMHLAAALKTPVIALFALTNPPEQWGPWQVPHRQLYHEVSCRICYSRVCPYQHDCLTQISPQMVVDASRDLLEEVGTYTANLPLEEVSR